MQSLVKIKNKSQSKITTILDTKLKNNKFNVNINSRLGEYKLKHLIVCIIILIVVLYVLYKLFIIWKTENYTSGDVPNMKRPFLNMYGVKKDGSEILTNIVFITHPFTRDECVIQYNDAKAKGVHFLGLSSYSEFPGPISNPHDILHDAKNDAWTKYDYFKLTRGWLTCFREENNKKWIKEGFPRINLAESNFANYEQHKPDETIKKEYDFIYICLKDGDKKEGQEDCPAGWQSEIRRWETVKQLLDIMCDKYKLKGLLIGRVGCTIPKQCHQLMEMTDFMEYNNFIKQYNKCRFILTASYADCSPRTTSEAMCFNLPVLMNKNILGGWEYINDNTGEFFDPDDIKAFPKTLEKFINKLNNNEYTPRDWFIKNYGKYNSGKKLKTFVNDVFKPDELNFKMDDVEYLKPGI